MILDRLDRASTYFNLHERLTAALRFLERTDLHALELGQLDIRGDQVFAITQELTTNRPDEMRFEAHQRYVDVQYIVEGVEAMGVADVDALSEIEAYDPDKDVAFYDGEGFTIVVPAGSFVIFHPQDAHKPCLMIDAPAHVRKVVVKVAV